jgi:DNA-binding HxlR family transcriptional regulator
MSSPSFRSSADRSARLATLFHRRWALPVVAELHRGRGAKLVTLINRLEASPGSVRAALDHLQDAGWVIPNPGYGHPMRPEYILTPAGVALAPACCDLDAALLRLDLRAIGLRKWSMPTLNTLRAGPARFTEIRADLPGVTDRALSLALGDLQEGELALRAQGEGAAAYAASRRARRMCAILGNL